MGFRTDLETLAKNRQQFGGVMQRARDFASACESRLASCGAGAGPIGDVHALIVDAVGKVAAWCEQHPIKPEHEARAAEAEARAAAAEAELARLKAGQE